MSKFILKKLGGAGEMWVALQNAGLSEAGSGGDGAEIGCEDVILINSKHFLSR